MGEGWLRLFYSEGGVVENAISEGGVIRPFTVGEEVLL